jgi:hypothetical protein
MTSNGGGSGKIKWSTLSERSERMFPRSSKVFKGFGSLSPTSEF